MRSVRRTRARAFVRIRAIIRIIGVLAELGL